MWDLIVSVPDHCLSFYFVDILPTDCNSRSSRKDFISISLVAPYDITKRDKAKQMPILAEI